MDEALRELAVYSSSTVENNEICLMIVRTGRKVRERVWEHTPSGNFSSWGPGNAISCLFAGHFHQINTKENAVEGGDEGHIFKFFTP